MRMLTRDQLSDLLLTVNVEALSKASGVSIKTIYRLRLKQSPPNYTTVLKICDALDKYNRLWAKPPKVKSASCATVKT